MNRLFAVMLGGYARGCNLELHDVVFVVGETIEDTYDKLVKKWFLDHYLTFHYDGYRDLSVVDGHRITLSKEKSDENLKLYFVHLGGYDPADFNELHKQCFLVGRDEREVKDRARQSWSKELKPHKDMQVDIESVLRVDEVDQYYLSLTPTEDEPDLDFHLGYNKFPPEIIPGGNQG